MTPGSIRGAPSLRHAQYVGIWLAIAHQLLRQLLERSSSIRPQNFPLVGLLNGRAAARRSISYRSEWGAAISSRIGGRGVAEGSRDQFTLQRVLVHDGAVSFPFLRTIIKSIDTNFQKT